MGTHDELLEQDGIYRQIFDIQTRIEERAGTKRSALMRCEHLTMAAEDAMLALTSDKD